MNTLDQSYIKTIQLLSGSSAKNIMPMSVVPTRHLTELYNTLAAELQDRELRVFSGESNAQ